MLIWAEIFNMKAPPFLARKVGGRRQFGRGRLRTICFKTAVEAIVRSVEAMLTGWVLNLLV